MATLRQDLLFALAHDYLARCRYPAPHEAHVYCSQCSRRHNSPQLIRDYREEDRAMVPHQFEIVSGTPMLISLKEIKINAELPPDVFELPDDVRALAAKAPPSN